MADTVKVSGLPVKTTIAETDFLVGNVGTGTDATGRVEIDALRTRLNISNQTVVGDIAHTGDQETSGNMKASTFEGNGALITGVVSAGTGGTSSASSLSLVCSSDGDVLGEKIALSKFSTPLADVDETGFKVRTGIPYTHEDDSIPFDKDINLQGNHIFAQTIQDIQPSQYAHYNGSTSESQAPDNIDLDFGTADFGFRVVLSAKTAPATNTGIFRKGSSPFYYARHNTDGSFSFRASDGTNDFTVFSDSSITGGEKKSIAVKSDRDGSMGMWIDGVKQTSAPNSPPLTLSNTGPLYVGSNNGAAFFNGEIYQLEFFNRLLTDDEAKALSSNPNKAIDWAGERGSNVEINIESNATADNGGTEANATTGWTSVNLSGTGANVFQSQGVTVATGSYAFEMSSNDTPTSGARIYKDIETDFSLELGKKYRITSKARHIGSGGNWRYSLGSTNNNNLGGDIAVLSSTDATYQSYEIEFVHSANTKYLVFAENSGGNDGGAYLDDISIIQLGATLRYKGADMTTDYLFDSSGNGNNASNTDVSIGNASRQLYDVFSTITAGLAAGSGTITVDPSNDQLSQIKSGRKVFLNGNINTSAVSGPSGTLRLTGLEYAISDLAENSERPSFVITFSNLGTAIVGSPRAFGVAGAKEIRLTQGANLTSNATDDLAGSIDANTILEISGFYFTDD